MWYFAWALGVGFACAAAILNAMWYELDRDAAAAKVPPRTP
jgi:cyd operon protein YbgT